MASSGEALPTVKAWDAPEYQESHSYIWQYGASLVEMLDPQPGERVLDLGCGTGHLAAEIARAGCEVIGIDNSPDMVRIAKENFPDLAFHHADARDFHFSEGFDAVFSNAALHWIKEAEQVLDSIAGCLKPGGRIVAEMGGRGNIESVVSALRRALTAKLGHPRAEVDPWYLPTIGQYSALLEQRGLEVSFANPLQPAHAPERGKRGVEGLDSDVLLGVPGQPGL